MFAASLMLAAMPAACGDDDDDGGVTAAPSPTEPPDAGGGDTAAPTTDLVDTASASGLNTLVAAVQAAGLESALRSPGPFTVFGPTDAAFGKVPAFLREKLLTPPYQTELGVILRYHAIPGSVLAADLVGKRSTPTTLLGATLDVDGTSGNVVINGVATVETPDVLATNGVLHVIGDVLLPTIADTVTYYDDGTNTFKTLLAALTAADLAATLAGPGPFTVFAPNDAAFAKIPKETIDSLLLPANKAQLQTILGYHVVAGDPLYSPAIAPGTVHAVSGPVNVTVSGSTVELDAGGGKSTVILTDLPASNGVTHVIDTVILPPG